ncbi:DUF4190 domain-containing protein [Lipingzhangella sp. LS1_29]|uniref:DUF4190 domain-containing protein n=1 Tax=Lipingzhangella rawalii TaxID=2055835 RepID=A0ABU2H1M3_9ACTN|nr:DUF4190 domain-containing protein [Lipingzhangella rawalii]MDS1269197.1 DUF4190 domain-containing protein [Lipingzhangella rawalii]
MSYSGYGPPNQYGYGVPSGPTEPPASKGNAIGALVANVVGLVMCCLVALPGLVLGIIALVTAESNPQTSRVCAIIAWVLFGLALIIGIVWLFLFGLPAMYLPAMYEETYYY